MEKKRFILNVEGFLDVDMEAVMNTANIGELFRTQKVTVADLRLTIKDVETGESIADNEDITDQISRKVMGT